MTKSIGKTLGLGLAALSSLSLVLQAPVANAQTAPAPSGSAPPTGASAPAPGGAQSGATYDAQAQQADRAYAAQYSAWAARYCVDQHNSNVTAGAVIGGLLGAGLGAAAGRGPGAVIGGLVGAGAGAAVGSASTPAACPPGYVVAPGAPAFAFSGAYYGPAYDPVWYNPWVWVGGRWVYYPYRYWYWYHPAYWAPGWHGGPWRYHYRPW